MTSERWRCFVAVPLPDELRADLAAAIDRWRADPRTEGLRWSEAASLHVTLAFLDGVDPAELPSTEARIRSIASAHPSTAVPTGRLGAFHRPGSVRVLWYGVVDPGGALAAIARELAMVLELPVGEPFRPHVTLARTRRRPVDLRGWIEAASLEAPAGHLEISEIRLVRSHLGAGPARYETLASMPLNGTAA